MTTPNDPRGSSGDGFRPYEPTNHPEDRPGGLPAYGESAGDTGAFGSGAAGGYGYAGAHEPYVAGQGVGQSWQGKPSAIAAIGWGFRATFSNWTLWIPLSLIFAVVYALYIFVTGLPGMLAFEPGDGETAAAAPAGALLPMLFLTVVMVAFGLIQLRLALRQVDEAGTGWKDFGRDVRWWQPLVVEVVIGIILGVVTAVFAFILVGLTTRSIDDPSTATDAEIAMKMVGPMLLVFAIAFLGVFLLSPFFVLMVWYAADGHSLGTSFAQGFKAGKNNYGQALLLVLINYLLGIVGVVTLGLGFLVISPATQLGCAHFYRQASGGNAPVNPLTA